MTAPLLQRGIAVEFFGRVRLFGVGLVIVRGCRRTADTKLVGWIGLPDRLYAHPTSTHAHRVWVGIGADEHSSGRDARGGRRPTAEERVANQLTRLGTQFEKAAHTSGTLERPDRFAWSQPNGPGL